MFLYYTVNPQKNGQMSLFLWGQMAVKLVAGAGFEPTTFRL